MARSGERAWYILQRYCGASPDQRPLERALPSTPNGRSHRGHGPRHEANTAPPTPGVARDGGDRRVARTRRLWRVRWGDVAEPDRVGGAADGIHFDRPHRTGERDDGRGADN